MKKYDLNLNYFGTHKIIGRKVGESNDVLDVGCNQGYLRRVIDESNKLWGVDIDAKELDEAMRVNGYQRVWRCDLNKDLPRTRRKYDVLILADVLEHLISPSRVLMRLMKNNLKDKGRVIISLPNVAHGLIRWRLLWGKFEYGESGILDEGHLHLYTVDSAVDLAEKAGLKVMEVVFSSDRLGWLIDKIKPLGSWLGYNIILVCQKKGS